MWSFAISRANVSSNVSSTVICTIYILIEIIISKYLRFVSSIWLITNWTWNFIFLIFYFHLWMILHLNLYLLIFIKKGTTFSVSFLYIRSISTPSANNFLLSFIKSSTTLSLNIIKYHKEFSRNEQPVIIPFKCTIHRRSARRTRTI